MEWKKRQIKVYYQGVQKKNDVKEINEDSGGLEWSNDFSFSHLNQR